MNRVCLFELTVVSYMIILPLCGSPPILSNIAPVISKDKMNQVCLFELTVVSYMIILP